MPDQDDRQYYDKPAPDGALDEILLLGRLSGKRETVHGELKYREPDLESMPQLSNDHAKETG